MAREERDNSGVLFRTDKEGNDRRPDYTGKGVVNGRAVRISAWIKNARNGGKFLSLAFSAARENSGSADDDDIIPF